MNSLVFLKAAYTLAWIVYLGYLVRILLRMRRVEGEIAEVQSNSRGGQPVAETQRNRA
jgi:hypothetical protein